MEHSSQARLVGIGGRPPDMVDPPPGCRFAPRCKYAQARCRVELPELVDARYGHGFACFYPLGVASPAAAAAATADRGAGRQADAGS
jgi:peptide/nickel transport system ATP-binding protein